ncbi:MAG: N-acetyl-gamma-glutamyl-phosphate reductase, partial [Candidatus Omnitrophica bacterium]|nr:N-acetyl-gamma-glutamyl-phosphate reductase [Candidatus Omnitrophota bacterium]
MVKCAVVGAKGYTGCELIKLLAQHPQVNLSFLADQDDTPQNACELIANLPQDKQLEIKKFDYDTVVKSCDVIFLALPHTKSIDFVSKLSKEEGKIIIDLSADFRLKDITMYKKWYNTKHTAPALVSEAVYGLPELYRKEVKKATIIANPGCYPTAIILGLSPLLKRGLINTNSVIIDAKTGVSGAGRNATQKNHFCEVYENFQSYKINAHQHMPEIEEIISAVAQKKIAITFVPHLLPILRGILASIYVEKNDSITADTIYGAYEEDFANEPFVRLMTRGQYPQTKNVEGTNYCDIGIYVDNASSRVIIISAIDN